MERLDLLVKEATYLTQEMVTSWQNYDFTEKSKSCDSRVPEIRFLVNVEVMLDEVRHRRTGLMEEYIREHQIMYNGHTYIFEISAQLVSGIVSKFYLDVYTPVGDGVGGKYKLVSEKLS